MNSDEIKRRIFERIDRDAEFADQLGRALEVGAWEIITTLIAQAEDYAIEKAGELLEWLKRQLS